MVADARGRPDIFDLFRCNRTLLIQVLIACTEPTGWGGMYFLGQWRSHPMAVTLAYGIDTDPTCGGNRTLDPAVAPKRWRDLRNAHILRALL